MPLNPMTTGLLGLSPLHFPDSKAVRVIGDSLGSCERFDVQSIPFDYLSCRVYGYTILAGGTRIPTQFQIDTRKPTLLVGTGSWYIDRAWYASFEQAAMERLGVSPAEARPFSWLPNVAIDTVEEPPYVEGQVLHPRTRLTPDAAPKRAKSGETVGGDPLISLDLEVDEPKKRTWSCKARRVGDREDGALYLTSRRVLFCPHTSDAARGRSPFIAAIRELTDVGCKPVEDVRAGAGRIMGLRLILVGDREEIFVVEDVVSVIEEFSRTIKPIE
jgi:hypothetical protein